MGFIHCFVQESILDDHFRYVDRVRIAAGKFDIFRLYVIDQLSAHDCVERANIIHGGPEPVRNWLTTRRGPGTGRHKHCCCDNADGGPSALSTARRHQRRVTRSLGSKPEKVDGATVGSKIGTGNDHTPACLGAESPARAHALCGSAA